MKLSENLKIIRKENNLSQEQLAEQLGVSRQAVSKWESDQSYPEMDKVLLICKLYGYGIDELMNENVAVVKEERQAKNNINKYIDDFFSFITKTVDMLSYMKFRQRVKCLLEQIFIGIFLMCIFAIIGAIGGSIVSSLFGRLSTTVYYTLVNILSSIYLILALVIGVAILLHIFKIRYLDYYEIVKETGANKEELKKEETGEKSNNEQEYTTKDNKKIFIEKKQEKIIIRDPEHSQSKFLTGILKLVLICIKAMAIFIGIPFIFSFIGLITLLVLSFLFVKTGLVFLGALVRNNFSITYKLYNFTSTL